MKFQKITLLFVIFSLGMPSLLIASSIERSRFNQHTFQSYWEVGIKYGLSRYAGHIDKENPASIKNPWNATSYPTEGVFAQYHPAKFIGLELALYTTRLSGKWNSGYPLPVKYDYQKDLSPPLSFKTGLTCYTLSTVWYLNQLFITNNPEPGFDTYIKVGIGFATVNPVDAMEWLPPSDNRRRWMSPMSAGCIWHFNGQFSLGFGAEWNIINTDRVDGIQDYHYNSTNKIDYPYYKAKEYFRALQLTISYRLGKATFWRY